MANYYSSQYTNAYQSVPSAKIPPGEVSGEVKSLVATFTPAAEIGTSDTLYLGKLPAGARVLSCHINFPASGATGIVDVGYQANGVDSADLDAFIDGVDPGAAAVSAYGVGLGMGKKFSVETTVVMTPTEVTASATGNEIIVSILYVVA
jgi:hypothetical protein